MSELIETNYGIVTLMDPNLEMEVVKTYGFDSGLALVWYYNRVKLYNAKEWILNLHGGVLADLVRARVFNEEQELHLWRSNQKIKGRHIKDNKEANGSKIEDIHWVDSKLPLNGSIIKCAEESYSLYSDKDQFKLDFPNSLTSIKEGSIYIMTRNYIDYNSQWQAGFVDCRFVKIENIN